MILVEPEALLTEASRMPGLDGQKMSKSYGNTIALREEPESVAKKITHHADRPGAREAHRSRQSREMPGLGLCTRSTPMQRAQGLGAEGLHHRRASAASNASSR